MVRFVLGTVVGTGADGVAKIIGGQARHYSVQVDDAQTLAGGLVNEDVVDLGVVVGDTQGDLSGSQLVQQHMAVGLPGTDKGFVSTLGLGCAGALAAAAVLNLLGATNTLPTVGVSMPFVSAGTTSLVSSMVMTGIVAHSSVKQKEENHEI